jgi:hypothetical protein
MADILSLRPDVTTPAIFFDRLDFPDRVDRLRHLYSATLTGVNEMYLVDLETLLMFSLRRSQVQLAFSSRYRRASLDKQQPQP